MDFAGSVAYLTTLRAFGWRLDLSRMQALCQRLGHPERAFRVVHVAGTNGKGSVTAMTASVLAYAGYRVGSYFSPYVFNVRERVMLAEPGQAPEMIPEDDFARLMTVLREHVEAVASDESIGCPTEFEVKTALALMYYREKAVDWAVLEVGLGGRLDATNVVDAEVAVITNIGLDHTDRLGDTLEAIAGEKAGIIKPGCSVVTGAVEPALEVILETAERVGASSFTLVPPGITPRHTPGLPGAYQRINAAVAEAVVFALCDRGVHVRDSAVAEGLALARLPGRFQIVDGDPVVILDGAHNTEAAEALATALRERYPDQSITLVFGMMARHNLTGVANALFPLASRVVATQPDDPGALPVDRIADDCARMGVPCTSIHSPAEAFAEALRITPAEGVIVVTGSFYLLGDLKDALGTAAARPYNET